MSLPRDHDERMENARLALEGLSLGDAFGERFFLPRPVADARIRARELPDAPWRYTDDTVMALAIVETLDAHGAVVQDALAERFASKYRADPGRGYGAMAHRILERVGEGASWQEVAPAAFGGMGSLGNGGAMRVAPVGGYCAGRPEAAAREAERSAEVTHAHPEGRAGAIAVAAAAARAATGSVRGAELLEAAADLTPAGATREGLVAAARLPLAESVATAARALGNGSRVTAPDTVPYALWCAARHLDDFEEALWSTVSGGGDRDTTCAMVGGLVALAVGAEGLPEAWRAAREPLSSLAGV